MLNPSKEDRQDINEQINEVHDENMVIERNVAQWGVGTASVHLCPYERLYLAWKVDKRGGLFAPQC